MDPASPIRRIRTGLADNNALTLTLFTLALVAGGLELALMYHHPSAPSWLIAWWWAEMAVTAASIVVVAAGMVRGRRR